MRHPQVFYKYMTSETTKIVLETSKLRWSSPQLFNDLLEFQRMPVFEPKIDDSHCQFISALVDIALGKTNRPTGKALSLRAEEMLVKVKEEISKKVNNDEIITKLALLIENGLDVKCEQGLREVVEGIDLSKTRVLCVTTSADNDAMWANYAANHTGCVLGFRHIKELDTPLLAAEEIQYSDKRIVVSSGVDFLLYGNSKNLEKEARKAIFYTKKSVWSYESEWRVLALRKNELASYGDYIFECDELESITFGAKISSNIEKILYDTISATYPSCEIYKIVIDDGEVQRKKIIGQSIY